MTDPVTLGSTIGPIIKAAANVARGTLAVVGNTAGTLNRLNAHGGAITRLSAQTTILSRAFIDEAIRDEIVLSNYMKSIHEWYVAQIITALSLNQMVSDKETVASVLSTIQTGQQINSTFGRHAANEKFMGQEAFLAARSGTAATESLQQNDKEKASGPKVSVRSVNVSEHKIGPIGELYEVTLKNHQDSGKGITIPIYIQMAPSMIPYDIAPRFIDMNVDPSLWKRWTMMTAGEMTFWKDFLLHRDVLNRHKAILKDPKLADALSDFMNTVTKKDRYLITQDLGHPQSHMSSNLSNSVVIFSEETVQRAKSESAIDLHRAADRDRYFRDTYTMIIGIIDPIHQRVVTYFNGIDGEVDSSYNDFKPRDSKFDPKDFINAMQAFSQNSIGRLR